MHAPARLLAIAGVVAVTVALAPGSPTVAADSTAPVLSLSCDPANVSGPQVYEEGFAPGLIAPCSTGGSKALWVGAVGVQPGILGVVSASRLPLPTVTGISLDFVYDYNIRPVDGMCGSPSDNSRWRCSFTMPANDVSIVFHLPTPDAISSFSAPVDPAPTVNKAQSGRVIPLKFSVSNQGHPVTGLTSDDVTVVPQLIGCESGLAVDAIETYASSPGLVDLGGGNYILNYRTSKSWAGSCGSLDVTTTGGGSHSALFSFK